MPTTTQLLHELTRTAKTFQGGSVVTSENRKTLASEMKWFLRTLMLAIASGATSYEIERAVAGQLVTHYLDQ